MPRASSVRLLKILPKDDPDLGFQLKCRDQMAMVDNKQVPELGGSKKPGSVSSLRPIIMGASLKPFARITSLISAMNPSMFLPAVTLSACPDLHGRVLSV